MLGAIPTLPQYAFMVWCSVQAQGPKFLIAMQGIYNIKHLAGCGKIFLGNQSRQF
jgi:hypothetical protein